MTYEAWRISYQSSESAAREAYATVAELHAENEKLKSQISDLESSPLSEEALDILRSENTKLKAELRSIDGALDDPRTNLTLTTAEVIWELKAELAEAKKDADRLKGLRELCGYVEDGSSQTIRITQDDATNDWIIQWNDKAGWVFSSSFKSAIDEAMKGK